jgi:hypothetical protein
MTQEYTFDREPNVQQGTVFALAAIPAGIVVYVLLYQFGFVASIVGFGVAWLATLLYRIGSGQDLDRTGAVRVAVVTLVTIVLAITAGIIWNVTDLWSADEGSTAFAALFVSDFWDYLVYDLSDWEYFSQYVPDILIGLTFGIIGCFSTLRAAFGRPRRVAPRVADPAPSAPREPGRYGIMADDEDETSPDRTS